MMLGTIIGGVRVYRARIEIDFKLHISQFLGTMGHGAVKRDSSLGGVNGGKMLTGNFVARDK
ncbi:hypothetical protein [Alicyclobacillus sp. SP_1]|uniref:hypothetical protein n=1 Tax=Alicyclobacillus sp. SP_1 TaxID=2942475 RepID=UPI00215833E3|nr:hypothetical protein [Alicyclobacillus sp. SP_1]